MAQTPLQKRYFSISDVDASDTLEVYLWDGIKTMKTIAPAKVINSTGVFIEKSWWCFGKLCT